MTHPITHRAIIPYTDDTVMALIVLKSVLWGYRNNQPILIIIDSLAYTFASLFGNNKYTINTLFDVRAHGLRNIKAGKELNDLIKSQASHGNYWWLARSMKDISAEGGCGSVMRT